MELNKPQKSDRVACYKTAINKMKIGPYYLAIKLNNITTSMLF